MEKYFAAANSSGGFVSWFDEIFAPEKFERVYLIKGGSGTGKSTLMKRIAEYAHEKSFTCEGFYCSSDPDSLDGLIIKSEFCRGIAFVDATAPHTKDPKIPGAVEEIVNLGEFWDDKKLISSREEITDLITKKSELFKQAYEFLHASGEFSKLLHSMSSEIVNFTKIQAAADRLVAQRMKRSHFNVKNECGISLRGISAISTKGIVQFDTYKTCKFVYTVEDSMSTAPFMLDALIKSAKRAGLEIIRAPSPLEPDMTEAISLPELEISIITGNKIDNENSKNINMERFIDRGAISSELKKERKIMAKCKSELLECALEKLSEVRRIHSELESIYISTMDFDSLNAFTENLLSKIFEQ